MGTPHSRRGFLVRLAPVWPANRAADAATTPGFFRVARGAGRWWLEEGVAPNLRRWGFNSAGWVREMVIRTPTIHRHSRNWRYEQYQ